MGEKDDPSDFLSLQPELRESYVSTTEASSSDQTEDQILAEVYQVVKKRQRAPPPGGYMFSRNDQVTTKMGRLPPSPCKCCGSSNHWDKECPDWQVYMERTTKAGFVNEQGEDKSDKAYQSAYGILLTQRLASMQVDDSKLHQGFEGAIRSDPTTVIAGGCKTESKARGVSRVVMEEIEDEHWQEERDRPKAESLLLHHVDDMVTQALTVESERPPLRKHPTPTSTLEEIEDEHVQAQRIKPKSRRHLLIGIDEVEDLPDMLEEPSGPDVEESDLKHGLHSETLSSDNEVPDAPIPDKTLPTFHGKTNPIEKEPVHASRDFSAGSFSSFYQRLGQQPGEWRSRPKALLLR